MKRTLILVAILLLTIGIVGGRAYLKYRDARLDGLTDQVEAAAAAAQWKEADRLLDQSNARFGSHPMYWLLRAKVECGRRRPGPCLDAYVKAVPGGGVADDEVAAKHLDQLLAIDGRAVDVGLLVRSMSQGTAIDVLEQALKHPEHDHRWNAVAQLEALGRGSSIDYVDLYILDLTAKTPCAARRRAVEKLGELGDEDALEPLKLARADSQGFLGGVCMGDSIDQAIKKLEGS